METLDKLGLSLTQRKLDYMFKENIGSLMMDSGGDNDRQWQRNQRRDLYGEPMAIGRFNAYGSAPGEWEVTTQVSTYHFLDTVLTYDRAKTRWLEQFRKRNKDYSNLEALDNFVEMATCGDPYEIVNTYNFDSLLDHVLQYVEFKLDGDDYVILSIHLGADVRGGYGRPAVFKLDKDTLVSQGYNELESFTDSIPTSCVCITMLTSEINGHWIRWDINGEFSDADSELTQVTDEMFRLDTAPDYDLSDYPVTTDPNLKDVPGLIYIDSKGRAFNPFDGTEICVDIEPFYY